MAVRAGRDSDYIVRILHILPLITARAGGPVAFAAEGAEALQALGIACTLFSTDLGQSPAAGERRKVEFAELPANADQLDLHLFPVSPPSRLAFSPSMARRLARVTADYDLVHVHSLWLFPQYARATLRASRRHTICRVTARCSRSVPAKARPGAEGADGCRMAAENAAPRRAAAYHD